jgi:hypothetical protein
MGIPSRGAIRGAGSILGAVLVVILLAAWDVPNGATARGSDVSLTVNRTGELAVEPLGRLLTARDLSPGQSAVALFFAKNTTGTQLAVRLRARADGVDLDDRLALRVTAWRRTLFAGTLRQLRASTRHSLVLSPGASVPVIVHVGLPARARDYRGRSASVSLELRSAPAASR